MGSLDWLTARPVAHRGLHDAAAGVIENMPAAFAAAIAGNFAIECDVQLTADGEAMVHHDHKLGRLTDGEGELASLTVTDLKRVPFKATAERMITLPELCDLVGGRVPLIVEIKSRHDNDDRLPARVAEVLRAYKGPVAAMSFDPRQVRALRGFAPTITRGIVAEKRYDHSEWSTLGVWQKAALAYLMHAAFSRPQFIAYRVADLPALAPRITRHIFGLPLLTWTVRTEEDRARAGRWADQMIFEGFRP